MYPASTARASASRAALAVALTAIFPRRSGNVTTATRRYHRLRSGIVRRRPTSHPHWRQRPGCARKRKAAVERPEANFASPMKADPQAVRANTMPNRSARKPPDGIARRAQPLEEIGLFVSAHPAAATAQLCAKAADFQRPNAVTGKVASPR